MSDTPAALESDVDQPGGDGATVRAELPADLTSARQVRSAVRQALAAWGLDSLTGDAELLASELAANAAEHGNGTPIGLALRRHAGPGGPPGITCEGTDTAPALPRRADPSSDAERGRGLPIVEALARATGVRATRPARPPGSPSPSPTVPTRSPGSSSTTPKPARNSSPSPRSPHV